MKLLETINQLRRACAEQHDAIGAMLKKPDIGILGTVMAGLSANIEKLLDAERQAKQLAELALKVEAFRDHWEDNLTTPMNDMMAALDVIEEEEQPNLTPSAVP